MPADCGPRRILGQQHLLEMRWVRASGRNTDEIAGWSTMDEDQQLDCWSKLPRRLASLSVQTHLLPWTVHHITKWVGTTSPSPERRGYIEQAKITKATKDYLLRETLGHCIGPYGSLPPLDPLRLLSLALFSA
jgi:predicted Fe-S protein YdhL (DUF1289 family)